MFWTILITLVSLCHLYVLWRVASLPWAQGPRAAIVCKAAGTLLWLLLAAGVLYGHGHDTPLAIALELVAMLWLGTLFLLTATLMATEVLTIGGLLLPNMTAKLRGGALLLGLCLAGLALVQGNRPPALSRVTLVLPGLPPTLDGTELVVMSDLHLGPMTRKKWLAEVMNQVRRLRPDLILLLGDIVEGHGTRPRPEISAALRSLEAPLGVWGVAGNHEFYGGPASITALETGGVRLLRDGWAEVRPGLLLAGVEEHSFRRRPTDGAGRLATMLASRPPNRATILLTHKPWRAEEAAQAGVGLMLAGHTHDGQIWPFNYLVKRVFPLLAGQYTVRGMPVLVCRGTGVWGPPMRLWRRGEILHITLHSP